jgi:alpha-D-ribose 1-methylphosphonate 5-triphosphate diphosphatase
LRFEIYALDAVEEISMWIDQGCVDILAFNDHIPHFREKMQKPNGLAGLAERSGVSVAEFARLIEVASRRADKVPGAIARLAVHARARGIPLLSHDDEAPEVRRWYHEMGCRICEFPVDVATASAARECGDDIVLGASNILRGGSHCGRLTALDAIADGLCTILASDYYYPSPLHAAFRLTREGRTDLASAWAMVSRAPARATGLHDRGEIAVGRRADLILVDDGDPVFPRILATVVGGRPAFMGPRTAGHFERAVAEPVL